jgi:hypothetical protein
MDLPTGTPPTQLRLQKNLRRRFKIHTLITEINEDPITI